MTRSTPFPTSLTRRDFLRLSLSMRGPLRLSPPSPGYLPLPVKFPLVTGQKDRLIVTQRRSESGEFTSYVWPGTGAPILDAPTTVEWVRIPTAPSLVTYVPRALHVRISGAVETIETDTSGVGDVRFTAEAPTPEGILHPLVTLATLPVPDGFLMTQATALSEVFLPLVSGASR